MFCKSFHKQQSEDKTSYMGSISHTACLLPTHSTQAVQHLENKPKSYNEERGYSDDKKEYPDMHTPAWKQKYIPA